MTRFHAHRSDLLRPVYCGTALERAATRVPMLIAFCIASLVSSSSSAQQRRIALLPIGGPGLTADVAQRHLSAVVDALESRGGLRVQLFTDPRRVAPFVGCEQQACRVNWTVQHAPEASGVVVARFQRAAPPANRMDAADEPNEEPTEAVLSETTGPGERPVHLLLESYDASGAPLGTASEATIPSDQLSAPRPFVDAAVNALALPLPPPRARVLLAANAPGASVLVDGHPVGEIPLRPLLLARGEHRLRVSAAGFAAFDTRIEVAEGQRLRLDVDLEPLESNAPRYGEAPGRGGVHWGVWVGAGAAALLLGVVLAFTLSGRDTVGFPVPPIQP